MFSVISEPIDVAALARSVRNDACGAVVTFVGVVRELADDGRPVTALAYEAHEAMALAEFERIATEARGRFGRCEISIVHRIGDLHIGEASVAIAVAAPHRSSAFDACKYTIDQLKERAPIWKKELYREGGSRWKANAGSAESQ